jgi:hypothetical protein
MRSFAAASDNWQFKGPGSIQQEYAELLQAAKHTCHGLVDATEIRVQVFEENC